MDISSFEERIADINAYMEFLETLDNLAQSGPPEIGGSIVSAQQQSMLYGTVYLQLYNLIEATATWCISSITKATSEDGLWRPAQLDRAIQQEWVRTSARTHVILNHENRLDCALEFCERLLNETPVLDWEIEKGGGGNWDITAIEAICERIGCSLNISQSVLTAAKRHFRDEKNAFSFVKDLRNQLAHGSISFVQSGENVTVGDLRNLQKCTVDYLRQVVESFQDYLDRYCYLEVGSRPNSEGV